MFFLDPRRLPKLWFANGWSGIGCAGEIRISEHDDYDKWAIDILVKFRDSEKLQLLTGQRQSGGVRHSRVQMFNRFGFVN